MRRKALVIAITDIAAALALVLAQWVTSGALKLQVMSEFHALREVGAIDETRLSEVGWDQLRGSPEQRAEEYFLRDAPQTFDLLVWAAAALLAAHCPRRGLPVGLACWASGAPAG